MTLSLICPACAGHGERAGRACAQCGGLGVIDAPAKPSHPGWWLCPILVNHPAMPDVMIPVVVRSVHPGMLAWMIEEATMSMPPPCKPPPEALIDSAIYPAALAVSVLHPEVEPIVTEVLTPIDNRGRDN